MGLAPRWSAVPRRRLPTAAAATGEGRAEPTDGDRAARLRLRVLRIARLAGGRSRGAHLAGVVTDMLGLREVDDLRLLVLVDDLLFVALVPHPYGGGQAALVLRQVRGGEADEPGVRVVGGVTELPGTGLASRRAAVAQPCGRGGTRLDDLLHRPGLVVGHRLGVPVDLLRGVLLRVVLLVALRDRLHEVQLRRLAEGGQRRCAVGVVHDRDAVLADGHLGAGLDRAQVDALGDIERVALGVLLAGLVGDRRPHGPDPGGPGEVDHLGRGDLLPDREVHGVHRLLQRVRQGATVGAAFAGVADGPAADAVARLELARLGAQPVR